MVWATCIPMYYEVSARDTKIVVFYNTHVSTFYTFATITLRIFCLSGSSIMYLSALFSSVSRSFGLFHAYDELHFLCPIVFAIVWAIYTSIQLNRFHLFTLQLYTHIVLTHNSVALHHIKHLIYAGITNLTWSASFSLIFSSLVFVRA